MSSVQDNDTIKLGGVTLPGLIKTVDITGSARMEEQTVQGSSSKPQQAVGYEDAKITIELLLYDSPGVSVDDKIAQLQALYKPPGGTVPPVLTLIEPSCAARGVSQVIIKGLTTKINEQTKQTVATLTLWEYVPVVISAAGYAGAAAAEAAAAAASQIATSAGSAIISGAAMGLAAGDGKHGTLPNGVMRRALTPGTAENNRLDQLRTMSQTQHDMPDGKHGSGTIQGGGKG